MLREGKPTSSSDQAKLTEDGESGANLDWQKSHEERVLGRETAKAGIGETWNTTREILSDRDANYVKLTDVR